MAIWFNINCWMFIKSNGEMLFFFTNHKLQSKTKNAWASIKIYVHVWIPAYLICEILNASPSLVYSIIIYLKRVYVLHWYYRGIFYYHLFEKGIFKTIKIVVSSLWLWACDISNPCGTLILIHSPFCARFLVSLFCLKYCRVRMHRG